MVPLLVIGGIVTAAVGFILPGKKVLTDGADGRKTTDSPQPQAKSVPADETRHNDRDSSISNLGSYSSPPEQSTVGNEDEQKPTNDSGG